MSKHQNDFQLFVMKMVFTDHVNFAFKHANDLQRSACNLTQKYPGHSTGSEFLRTTGSSQYTLKRETTDHIGLTLTLPKLQMLIWLSVVMQYNS